MSGTWFEHLETAGALNPFSVLGINPVPGLTVQDICDQAQMHVEGNAPTRGPRIPNASQITMAWRSPSSQADLDRSI
ncbi:hypothetical protein MMC31_004279 [Peltigera leucophlebia]|nr:hypothetical protein [Peltigera leucophlebia]